ncbi:hypothetical protein [Psychromicrobium xiongbiense]|uniref:hypothetical protein n=1 Tax=Psychromicrobium xiongbiense TaxID=3051184 RepID=UPI0025539120|nr:hypothetical protein [Psychromicrobium sp. YIM S02556]
MNSLTAMQGSQPQIFQTAVGIMAVGDLNGVPAARLMLRGPEVGDIVDLRVGDRVHLEGRWFMRLDAAIASEAAPGAGSVTLSWEEGSPDE